MGSQCSTLKEMRRPRPGSRAMMLEPVLSKVGEKLSSSCLWALRSTCHKWNSAFVRVLRNNDDFTVVLFGDLSMIIEAEENSVSRTSINSFMEVNTSGGCSSLLPLVSYQYRLHFPHITSTSSSSLQKFVSSVGVGLRCLHRRLPAYTTNQDLNLFRRALAGCPKLEELQHGFGSPQRSCASVTSLNSNSEAPAEISDMPQLRVFVITNCENVSTTNTGFMTDVVRAATNLRSLRIPTAANLHVLTVLSHPEVKCVGSLQRLELYKPTRKEMGFLRRLGTRPEEPSRLEYFKITLCFSKHGSKELRLSQDLYFFLCSQAANLNRLFVEVEGSGSGRVALPRIEALTDLRLTFPIVESRGRTNGLGTLLKFGWGWPGGSLQNTCPRLERFAYDSTSALGRETAVVERTKEEEETFDQLETLVHRGVRSLELRLRPQDSTHAMLLMFRALFPFVTHLEVSLYIKSVEKVTAALSCLWTLWPSLQSLHVDLEGVSCGPFSLTDIGGLGLATANSTLQRLRLDMKSGALFSEECTHLICSALGPAALIELL